MTDRCEESQLRSTIAGFPLRTYCQYENRIDLLQVPIERDVAVRASADHELPIVFGTHTSNQRVSLQHIDSGDYFIDSGLRIGHRIFGEVEHYPFDVIGQFRRQFDPGHVQGVSFRAMGRAGRLPWALSSR